MPKTLGQHIRDHRKSKGLTLHQVCDKNNLSYTFLCQLENDKVNPSINFLERLADTLEISLPEIVNYKNDFGNKHQELLNKLQSLLIEFR